MSTVPLLGVAFIIVWIVILALYMRSSHQQEQLEDTLDDLEQTMHELESESNDAH